MLRTMLDSNPGMRAMMQNPAFIQQMLNPQAMQARAAFGLLALGVAFWVVFNISITH